MVGTRVCGGRSAPFRSPLGGVAGSLALLLGLTPVSSPAAQMPRIEAPSIVRATPALWVVRDADTTVYLFGTFHSLDGRTVWFDDKVRHAFEASGELVLETVVPADLAAGADEATEIGPDGKRRLKPFMAQTRTATSANRAMGLSVENGADMVLRRVAEGVGKPVSGLEGFEEQLRTLSNIPTPPPSSAAAAPAPASAAVTVQDLLGAWARGDTAAYSTMLAGFEAKAPQAYRMLIADRNARWGQWIVNRLDQPGTVFVAVGTGHLAGRHSVQQWLSDRGVAAARVS